MKIARKRSFQIKKNIMKIKFNIVNNSILYIENVLTITKLNSVFSDTLKC